MNNVDNCWNLEYPCIRISENHQGNMTLAYLTVITSPMLRSIPFTCAINMAATASYSAVPSMLIVAPIGATNFATRMSIPLLSLRHSIVTGRVAEL